MIKFFIALMFGVLFSANSFAQEKPITYQRTFYYSFTHATSMEQVEELRRDIESLKNVVKVKSEFKLEKGAGQVIVIVEELKRTSEGQVFFSVKDLKRLIVENDLTPHELRQEDIILQK